MSFFEIGVFQPKTEVNIGTLWRTAYQLGASGIFTIGQRYKTQSSDTCKSTRHIPLRRFLTIEDFISSLPRETTLVGIEMGGIPLSYFSHPKQATYLLGAEDHGLPKKVLDYCNCVLSLEAVNQLSYNVAVAGSIVLYDRVFLKEKPSKSRNKIFE